MKRIALVLAAVAIVGCTKKESGGSTMTTDTTRAMSDTTHMMMSDSAHMMKSDSQMKADSMHKADSMKAAKPATKKKHK
jgi:hypothetical protein